MANDFDITIRPTSIKREVNIWGSNKKKRKPFSTQTKKRVWMKAGNHNPDDWRTGFVKTSYCMNARCRLKDRKLHWDESWEFELFFFSFCFFVISWAVFCNVSSLLTPLFVVVFLSSELYRL
jgi:hypothetical protein